MFGYLKIEMFDCGPRDVSCRHNARSKECSRALMGYPGGERSMEGYKESKRGRFRGYVTFIDGMIYDDIYQGTKILAPPETFSIE